MFFNLPNFTKLFAFAFTLFFAGCNAKVELIPRELNVKKPVYMVKKELSAGPTGTNKYFYVFDLSPSVARKIQADPDLFFSDLTLGGYEEYNGYLRFGDWHTTPVEKKDGWNGWRDKQAQTLSVKTFYGIEEFVVKIDKAQANLVETLISDEGNYFAKGGITDTSFLVVSPSKQKVFLLYR